MVAIINIDFEAMQKWNNTPKNKQELLKKYFMFYLWGSKGVQFLVGWVHFLAIRGWKPGIFKL